MPDTAGGLRIAQIAPIGGPVRPDVGESVELLVSQLCEGLLERGHSVTLFATGNSQTSAELRFLYERGYEEDEELWDWQFMESMHVAQAYAQATEFEVVHCHSYHHGLPLTPFVSTPNVHTHHVEMSPAIVAGYNRFEHVHLIAVSQWQRRHFASRPNVHVIHHGIETASFPLGEGGDYLLYLGRMLRDKGPAKAVEVARAVDMPLILAGPPESDFDEQVAPLVDGDRVTYLGRVDTENRNRLLAGAAALVYPLLYPEPFGLVLIEAMACGTPVVGVGIGAVPELVEPGVTGQLAPTWEGLAELVPAALALDREQIRARAVERFDVARMIDEHEALYRQLAAARRGRAA